MVDRSKALTWTELRVGLVSFGSPNVASAEEGFVKVHTDLTSDLDALYGKLMALGVRNFGPVAHGRHNL